MFSDYNINYLILYATIVLEAEKSVVHHFV